MFAAKNELFTRPSGYTISRSVRLRSSASAYFSRSLSTANTTTWTVSFWFKSGLLSSSVAFPNFFEYVETTGAGRQGGISPSDAGSTYQFSFYKYAPSTYTMRKIPAMVFRDPSAWYHAVIVWNTTVATAEDRAQIWINGTRVTNWTTNTNPAQNETWLWSIFTNSFIGAQNRNNGGSIINPWDGYLTEVNFIDGQALTPSSFGETNAVTGVWQPKKYSGTYGNNGFYLNFSDNSSNTATTIGKDYSGNGNNWTPNNISVTSGVTYDSMIDSPTVSAASSNYAVLNPVTPSSYRTLSNGNLRATGNTSTNSGMSVSSLGVSTGKIVWEETINTVSGNFPGIGCTTAILSDGNGQNMAASNTLGVYYRANGDIYKNSSSLVGSYTALSAGNVVRFELDADALTCAIYRNNTLVVTVTGLTAGTFYPANVQYNGSISDINLGQQPFANTPNSGFNALNTFNLPTPTIVNGATVMAATLYTGTSGNVTVDNSVNGVSFKPDFLWVKARSNAQGHSNIDSVRGVSKLLQVNLTNAESTLTNPPTINSNGFTSTTDIHTNGYTYVAWQWQAGQGTSSSNTNGSITSTVSVNATAGFSIVKYTTTGSNATVGHGLGVVPAMIITRDIGASDNWITWHKSFVTASNTDYLYLNTTIAKGGVGSLSLWNSTAPTSSVFSLGTYWLSSHNNIAYCFAEVAGYSAFGSYTGNGSSDGPFVFTGFRPRWVMIKRTDSANDWWIVDTSRNSYNLTNSALYPNSSSAETSNGFYDCDILSNGFKIRATNAASNASGGTYIYAAFAENPFRNALAR